MELLQYQQKRIKVIREVLSMIGNDFILKGGTALILYYGLDRYSEDIDLDAKTLNMNILNKLKNPGYEVWNLSVKKDTDTVFRVMIDYGAKSDKGSYPLKLEISSRNKDLIRKGFLKYHNDDGVNVYNIKELVNMKTNTFAQRTKARDLYDLGYLIKTYPEHFSKEQLFSIIENIDFKGIDTLEYILELEMQEHHLAQIDSSEYIINLYEDCHTKLTELNLKETIDLQNNVSNSIKLNF